jgi:hypothetical protein
VGKERMKIVIDPLIELTGWSVTAGEIELETHKQYCASGLDKSIKVLLRENGTLVKTYPEPVAISGYNQIRFNIVGRKSNFDYKNLSTIKLTITLSDGFLSETFLVPVSRAFEPVTFLTNLSSIHTIQYESTELIEFIISEIIAYREIMPLDIIESIKQSLVQLNASTQVGSITASNGDREVTIQNASYINKYTCVRIGTNTHQIKDVKGNRYTFYSTYSGSAILQDYVNEPVYIFIPVNLIPDDIEAIIPGIGISNPFNVERVGYEKYSFELDSIHADNTTVRVNVTGSTWKYEILLEGLSREPQIMQLVFNMIKRFIDDRHNLWVNGSRIEYTSTGVQQIEYGDANELLSKINCIIEIVYTEETWASETQKKGFTTSLEVESSI